MDVLGESHFTVSEFKMSFGCMSYIAQHRVLLVDQDWSCLDSIFPDRIRVILHVLDEH